jgi:hypothetical protein
MIRPAFALLCLVVAPALNAQISVPPGGDSGLPNLPALAGTVQGDVYFAPSGVYSVTIPVLPELGGTVTDTANVATFQDSFCTHISIAAFKQDATEKWKLETSGTKDYLKDFFSTYVARDFFRTNPKASVDPNARFVPSVNGGALISYITLPGGSMFYNPDLQITEFKAPPTAKRGNMVFVKNGYVFVISTELAEFAVEGTAYKKTAAEDNEILRDRLIDIARKIRFTKPADSK